MRDVTPSRCSRLIGAVVLSALAAAVSAENLGKHDATTPLILPLDTTALTGEIAVEVDGIDMSEFVSLQAGQVVLAEVPGLIGNNHEVAVYLLQNDGFVQVASFSFSTVSSNRLSVSVNAQHEATLGRLNGDGFAAAISSGDVGFESADGRLIGQFNYLGTSEPSEQINGNALDIGEYLLEYNRAEGSTRVTARLGHQELEFDRALVGDVSRRGVSLDFGLFDERVEIGAFASHTDEILGARNLTGLSDATRRMQGARIAFSPFPANDLKFSLQTYQGTGAPYGDDAVGNGVGVSFSLDGSMLEERLRYGAVYGRTDWDEDANGPLLSVTGQAFLSYASYDIITPEEGDRSLTVELAREKTDLGYFSLANPGVATGAEIWRITLDYSTSRFGLTLLADTQKTNEGGPADWPVDRISQLSADGSYDLQGQGIWEGTTLRFGGSYVQQDRVLTPNPLLPPEDYAAATLYLGLDKSVDRGSWSLDYAITREDDKSVNNLDTLNHSLSAALDHTVNERAQLTGSATYTYAKGDGSSWDRFEANLGLNYALDPDTLFLRFDGGVLRTDEPFAQEGDYVAAELGWRFIPNAELILSATHADGAYAIGGGTGKETTIALTLRATTNFTR